MLTQAQMDRIRDGAVFIYPTDTVYAIGCDARNAAAVQKIRALKARQDSPFSVIAPSKRWIRAHCRALRLELLPGPYTLILKLRKTDAVAANVCFGPSLGVRMPAHWITAAVARLGIPVVTTSVNKHGRPLMTCREDADPEILAAADFIMDEGRLSGKASTIVNTLTGEEIER